jgi:hypothetical protein
MDFEKAQKKFNPIGKKIIKTSGVVFWGVL